MALSEIDFSLIERYLEQDLSTQEQTTFENKLADPLFLAELERQKTALSALHAQDKAAIKKELQELYEEVKQKPGARPAKVLPLKYWAAAAAFILFAISIGYYFISERSSQDLYASYYQPFPADPITRGAEGDVFNEAMKSYRSQDYSQAKTKFEDILQKHSDSTRLHLFLGNSYLNLDQFKLAQSSFTQATKSKDAFIRQHAQWYLALTYLASDDKASAKAQLNELIQAGSIYQKESSQLLAAIE